MSDQRIKMTPQELNAGAKFLGDRRETIISEVSSLKRKIDEVAAEWEGAAQNSFVNQFHEMYPMLSRDLPEIINGIEQMLNAAADAMRETDASLASAFKGQ